MFGFSQGPTPSQRAHLVWRESGHTVHLQRGYTILCSGKIVLLSSTVPVETAKAETGRQHIPIRLTGIFDYFFFFFFQKSRYTNPQRKIVSCGWDQSSPNQSICDVLSDLKHLKFSSKQRTRTRSVEDSTEILIKILRLLHDVTTIVLLLSSRLGFNKTSNIC